MHGELRDAVGPGRANHHEDVLLVQRLLARKSARLGVSVVEDGRYDPNLERAVRAYQRRLMRMTYPDGVVAPRSATFLMLTQMIGRLSQAGPGGRLRLPPRSNDIELTWDDYERCAARLKCEAAALHAVADNESPGGAFDGAGHPVILYERHIFSSLAHGQYNALFPDLSNRLPYQLGGFGLDTYGKSSEQYSRLMRAYALNAEAALQAASWGKFQILGNNFAMCGYGSVHLFVYAMCESVQNHLDAFTAYITAKPGLLTAIRRKDWATIARDFNGTNYRQNRYDVRLQEHYETIRR